jgi:hypothetical protein
VKSRRPVIGSAAAVVLLLSAAAPDGRAADPPRCAQPVSAGAKPVASDCLFILRTAVGLQSCSPECACAPKGTLPVKATDALLCLKTATGQTVTLSCPCVVCEASSCEQTFATCEQDVVAAENDSLAACPTDAGAERDACLARAQSAVDAGDRICDAFHAACPSCCTSGGINCNLAPEVPRAVGDFQIPTRDIVERTDNLPPGPNGVGFMLLPLPDGALGFDPFLRTPATAAAECAGAVLACFSPGERNWAGCLAVVPTCTSDRPWEDDGPACCTTACVERYEELRRAGRGNPAAFTAAIYEAPSCMPGLDEFTQRGALR